ncbi:MAG: hypothetical protein JF597_47965 [Streptomyces sp.]|uniref:hypothetical protein n=1 Tax=Streptomyces sp. TaxID=1931 RepID=UPI0025EDE567|nr:hypothetical protein [Streptomyces sp.]MBW8801019.1 hypothetical protein [Streptomyces sp.]
MTARYSEFMFGLPWLTEFFHQDAYLVGPTPADVVTYHLSGLSPEGVMLVRRDAQRLADGLQAAQIEAIWESCTETGPYLYPLAQVADGKAWMRQIVQLCDIRLSAETVQTELSPTDLLDRPELASEVLTVVREYQSRLGSDVSDALLVAVASCTADLAFRFLLRALPQASRAPHQFTITSTQYTSLKQLAAAFDYGEYALSDLDVLIDT